MLRYLQMFQGKNPWKILPIDFNRSEITDIVLLVWSSCRVKNYQVKDIWLYYESYNKEFKQLDYAHSEVQT